jgi:ubiquinone/menaquinone biosynthesis C-methylase UbiE
MEVPVISSTLIKSSEEARLTIRREQRADRGLFSNRTLLAVMSIGTMLGLWTFWSLIALMMILLTDFVAFIVRRSCLLEEFGRGTPLIVTATQATAVDKMFALSGAELPSMTDWERTAGLGEAPPWKIALRYEELLRVGKPVPGSAFLDVGCGDGRLGWRFGVADRVRRYVGIDLGFDLVRELKVHLPKSDAIQAGADNLPIKSGSLDFIACTEAFEHFSKPDVALREFARCLAPKGRVLIQSPSALRLRNVNPLHILQCVIGSWFPCVLQPLIVHEHTFTRTYTYHWDFTLKQFRQYARKCGLAVKSVHCATYRFDPNGSPLHRLAYFGTRHVWPLTLLGWDLTIVLDKV